MRRFQAPFNAFLNALTAVNLIAFTAGVRIPAPAAGFRPTLAARPPVENDPEPISCTASHCVTTVVMVPISATSVSAASALVNAVLATTAFDQFQIVRDRSCANEVHDLDRNCAVLVDP